MVEVLIVGGGPAGLSAALVLGRCRRRVLLCDAGHPRNAASRALHGFLTRDGVPPLELRRLGRREVKRYGVEFRDVRVLDVRRDRAGFLAKLEDGRTVRAPFLILATGVVDELPPLEGFRRFYGKGVFHCPYCDGWEQRNRFLAAYGRGASGLTLALALKTWSPDVALLTDGPARLQRKHLERLRRHGVVVRTERILKLAGGRSLERIDFRRGAPLKCEALFFQGAKYQRSRLCGALGCEFTRKGAVRVRKFERAGPPGLFVVGDASAGTQMAITAAAEGVRAAVAVNEELNRRETG